MEKYILVTWPDSQSLIEESWFNECELVNTEFGQTTYGNSAYLVPEKRYESILIRKMKRQIYKPKQ